MVIATQPALVAGGSTIWMRSPRGERGGQERGFLIDALAGRVCDQFRQPLAPIEIRERHGFAAPSPRAFPETPRRAD